MIRVNLASVQRCATCHAETRARGGACRATPECRAEYSRRYMADYNYKAAATVRCICGADVRVTHNSTGKAARCDNPECIAARADHQRTQSIERSRVWQAKHRKTCDACGRTRLFSEHNPDGLCTECEPRAHAVMALLAGAKKRAEARGIPFGVTLRHMLPLPDVCPYLGIPLRYRHPRKGSVGASRGAASLDRVDPRRGYEPGNVIIVSRRANTIKNDATPEELRRIADAVEAIAHAQGEGWVKSSDGSSQMTGPQVGICASSE